MKQLETLTEQQLAKLIAQYNGQKGTDKQVERLVKFYQTKDLMINFLKPRLNK